MHGSEKWKVKGKSLSRVRLSDPMDYSLPGSSIHGIFQARVLEGGAIAFSRTSNLTTPQQLIIDYNLILLVIQVVSIMD